MAERNTGKKWAKRLLRGLLICGGTVVCAVACCLIYIIATAPKLASVDVTPSSYRTVVTDDGGEVILTLAGESANRVYADLEEIPDRLEQAVVAIEDERFYQHVGVDMRGIARAAWRNVTSGRITEGASTITQQLIKNNVFTDWTQEETTADKVVRKLQEQWLALQLERRESKEWILENYLNTINMGGGTWGVKTAAMRYFGKELSDLTLSECAVLAGITKSPNGYNPLKNPEQSRQRQLLVLGKMLELEMISREEYDEAVNDNVYGRIQRDNVTPAGMEIQSYFEDALVYQVVEDLRRELGYSEEDAWQLLYHGGLTIRSTQSSTLQAICEEEINRDAWYNSDAQATVVLMEPATGQVKAIVGGRGDKTASLTLNRATSSVRQPGSTIKVVGEYAAALDEQSATLGTVYDDAPHTYSDGTAIRNASGTYGGRTTIRDAIARSVNVVALKCFQDTGIDRVWNRLEQFGFTHLTEKDRVEALALGGTHGGVTNLELTAAYSAIANDGVYLEPAYYTEILDRNGRTLLTKVQERRVAVQSATAALLTEAMRDVLTEGTGTQAAVAGVPLAGKSGTSSGVRDAWFVGFSPELACGVWGGYDDFTEQTNGQYVKKIWKAVMARSHEAVTVNSFTGTEGLNLLKICTKCGNLAVEGLCDNTVQGDQTWMEYFVPGTEPTENCACHVAVSWCTASGGFAGRFCPVGQVEKVAYLREGTAGTPDAEAVLDPAVDRTCWEHTSWWDLFFPDGEPEEPETPAPELPHREESHDGWFNWREWFRL